MDSTDNSLTERVGTYFTQLSSAAKNLNSASDELGQAINAIDAALQKLNLGVPTWIKIHGADDQNLDYWSRDLGYAKVGNKWGVALRTVFAISISRRTRIAKSGCSTMLRGHFASKALQKSRTSLKPLSRRPKRRQEDQEQDRRGEESRHCHHNGSGEVECAGRSGLGETDSRPDELQGIQVTPRENYDADTRGIFGSRVCCHPILCAVPEA